MPEVDDYFKEFNINDWSYDGFLKFLTIEKCREEIWIDSLIAISKNNKYPVRCRKKANHISNDYSPVIVVIPSKQSIIIFNI
ncbi:3383_t:CDS:1, partial [Scutellospora calospora]